MIPKPRTTAPLPVASRDFQITNGRSLADFKQNTAEFCARLKASGRPEILTVDGCADLVIQHVASYQKLLDELDRLQAIDGIRRGLLDVEKGRGVSLETMDIELRSRLDLPPRKQ